MTNKLIRTLLHSMTCTLVLLAFPLSVGAQDIAVGTGGLTGLYYPAGSAICKLANDARHANGPRCFTESTKGSVYNINAIMNGELEFGIAQSDVVFHAYRGTGAYKDVGAQTKLRAVASLFAEPFTLVVRPDSGIKSFRDLSGKRVNIGNPGSGQRATMEVVMNAFDMDASDFGKTTEMVSSQMGGALCKGEIDAAVYTVGHPVAALTEITTECGAIVVDVTGPEIEELVAQNPFYMHATIPGGLYENNSSDVKTFGVTAMLVTSSDVSEAAMSSLISPFFTQLDEFKKLHDAFSTITQETLKPNENNVPIHSDVQRLLHKIP